LEAGQVTMINSAEQQLPTFPRDSQNMDAVAVLLDTLPAPSTEWVGEVYQWLKNILGTTTAQQAESSLHHRVKASILIPIHPKDEGQRATQWAPEAGTTSSPGRFSIYNRLSRPDARSEPQVHRWHRLGYDDVCETCAMGAMMIAKDAASVLKGLAHRRLEAPCATLISQSIFERQATLSKPTPVSGWRITTLRAKRAE
jgi:hypothetical protein